MNQFENIPSPPPPPEKKSGGEQALERLAKSREQLEAQDPELADKLNRALLYAARSVLEEASQRLTDDPRQKEHMFSKLDDDKFDLSMAMIKDAIGWKNQEDKD